ncbi:hypothetical protein Celaphus_00014654, partial [Cervus elaphus hippelaphus]
MDNPTPEPQPLQGRGFETFHLSEWWWLQRRPSPSEASYREGRETQLQTHPVGSVDGGELFDRIIDDNCSLTEFDTILFIRQICEGIRHMHQMYILHLDLKVGGRFGQVHKCEEKATGLKLAAKIIKTRGVKDKDDVRNEISVMNQLDHVNLIQLYDAFESKNDIVLVMEYCRTPLDPGILTRMCQNCICQGMEITQERVSTSPILTKPENILCVNRDTKQIKIIDFGLARRYKPREKLKVNFGTPEFLAPEVVNYDFVSFPTDMWSVGVITYM